MAWEEGGILETLHSESKKKSVKLPLHGACIGWSGTCVVPCCVLIGWFAMVGVFHEDTERIWKVWPHLSLSQERVSQGPLSQDLLCFSLEWSTWSPPSPPSPSPSAVSTCASFPLRCSMELMSSVFHSSCSGWHLGQLGTVCGAGLWNPYSWKEPVVKQAMAWRVASYTQTWECGDVKTKAWRALRERCSRLGASSGTEQWA